ncbi:hypothetical protein HBI56_077590 [Parastagonospora nodorum]|uniref:Uncharacterized protein n=1 Tax=Phaeosphaeria nodorum (strain SN15 / ATCC MYA-4574 / FGSC 10173) TaxID=321614 RepID=A0A7U2HXE7_PHANO|nr:hypothetical protein HBH56_149600 [Parastagonospora nodorum]QRC94198.1 hypothetical protein JI435_405340 [Parastagonospora nodorum SN15]KAH3928245.1 hypothetical protein HBH54_135500 [Parastagonospora nodorum]KAH3946134.1 hypothetical protein HBH53_137050 [Parastagonospora nodorum]KAH3983850.1 hypothetical protein HBH52_062960 [Parastagonospora nodorum]
MVVEMCKSDRELRFEITGEMRAIVRDACGWGRSRSRYEQYRRNVSRRLQTRPKSVAGDGRRSEVRVEDAVADRDGAGSVKVAIGHWPGAGRRTSARRRRWDDKDRACPRAECSAEVHDDAGVVNRCWWVLQPDQIWRDVVSSAIVSHPCRQRSEVGRSGVGSGCT